MPPKLPNPCNNEYRNAHLPKRETCRFDNLTEVQTSRSKQQQPNGQWFRQHKVINRSNGQYYHRQVELKRWRKGHGEFGTIQQPYYTKKDGRNANPVNGFVGGVLVTFAVFVEPRLDGTHSLSSGLVLSKTTTYAKSYKICLDGASGMDADCGFDEIQLNVIAPK